jgi:hypothetical protein
MLLTQCGTLKMQQSNVKPLKNLGLSLCLLTALTACTTAPTAPAKVEPAKPTTLTKPVVKLVTPPAASVQIQQAQFGIFDKNNKFIQTTRVPYILDQDYGWVLKLKTTQPRVKIKEELILPTPPAKWEGNGFALSADKRKAVQEKLLSTQKGSLETIGMWGIVEGDPHGKHLINLYVDNKLIRTFHFNVQ